MNAQQNAPNQTAAQNIRVIQSTVTERNGFVKAREFMARGFWCIVGLVLILVAFGGGLVLGVGSADTLPTRIGTRISYRLHHPLNCPAWLYFGTLLSCLFLLIGFLFRKRVQAVADSNPMERPSDWICFILVTCGLMTLGEIAIRQAIACSW